MYYLSDVYPCTLPDAGVQLDKLLRFLLHHFESEVTEYESFLQIENSSSLPTGNALQTLGSDIDRICLLLNQIRSNMEELDLERIRIVRLEEEVRLMSMHQLTMQNQLDIATKAIAELKSEPNTKQKHNDK